MRVGILTFHSQLNYGGVLQAWAEQSVLRSLGHDVVVVDRWLDSKNKTLLGPFAGMSAKEWGSFFIHAIFGCGQFAMLWRHFRTIRFVRQEFNLTPYHFFKWSEMEGRNLGVDCLVVGSDQVWNALGEPSVYLLEGAPHNVRAIAYAASFSMPNIPAAWILRFRKGLGRFSAVSVREGEGVTMAASVGIQATHVLDPTQLLFEADWLAFAFGKDGRTKAERPQRRTLVCYFLSYNVAKALPILRAFAKRTGCEVYLFCDGPFSVPSRVGTLSHQALSRFRGMVSSIHVCIDAGPREFVRGFARADWVVSDSFHALMFASIFRTDMRILRPKMGLRQKMFSRIEDFGKRYVKGNFIVSDLQEALDSLGVPVKYDEQALDDARAFSRRWLQTHLCSESKDA